MKILFCNITYMNKYMGITEDDMPLKGGKWVEKNKDAHEQWNFLNVDGYCYGFVMNRGDQFAIERIDKEAARTNTIDDVTVVWCALNDLNETVIVGWYEHATVYRYYQESVFTPLYGINRSYFCKADVDNCYLLPENKRCFKIGRASQEGSGRGFGQQNYWYAESAYARSELIPEVVEYMQANRNERINRTRAVFEDPGNNAPLSDEENTIADELADNENFFDFLPYAYRNFNATQSADAAYDVALALSTLHQYKDALKWYEKLIEIEGRTWDNTSYLPYLYQQNGMYKESVDLSVDLLTFEEAKNDDVRHELYGIIADGLFFQNKISEAIEWLDKIIAESNDSELIKYTISVRKELSTL